MLCICSSVYSTPCRSTDLVIAACHTVYAVAIFARCHLGSRAVPLAIALVVVHAVGSSFVLKFESVLTFVV